MTTKVEQLVMGAFWEAAYDAFCKEEYGRCDRDLVEDRFALHLATLIRTRGIESFDGTAAREALDARTNHLKFRINETAKKLDNLAAAWRDFKRDEAENPMADRFENDARKVRELLEGL